MLLRLAQEQSMLEGTPLCIGFLDMGTFFMSCVKEIQWEVERWTGVDPDVSDVVRELHAEVVGRYETAWGLTDGFRIARGNGQGCVNGAVRSKLQIGVMQRMISKHVPGYRFTGAPAATPQAVYADDCAYACHDLASLQLAFDTCWLVTRACGLKVMIKGKKKTAFMATYWDGAVEKDVTGWTVRLPDGRVVPQVLKRPSAPLPKGQKGDVHSYKHLGTELTAGWKDGMDEAREKVVMRCTQVVKLIGRIPVLTNEQMSGMMDLAVGGIVGYYGRATPLTWQDCSRIEQARAYAVRVRGLCPGVPRVQMYAAPEEGGLSHAHAYQVAAAAFVDQVDRALCGGDGEPARVAMEAAIASTCWRLGCRRGSPLAWDPQHLRHALDEDLLVEAWLLAKMRTGVVGLATGMEHAASALRADVWEPGGEDRERRGPMLWERDEREDWAEVRPCRYRKRMAEVGMVWWSDVTDMHTGKLLTWQEARRKFGERLQGKADRRDFDAMMAELQGAGNARHVTAWLAYVAGHAGGGDGEADSGMGTRWEYEGVLGARRAPACFGGWEYLMRWRGGGEPTWESAGALSGKQCGAQLARDLRAAREGRYVSCSMFDALKRQASKGTAAQRATGKRLLRACEAGDATDAEMDAIFAAYKVHAACVAGGKVDNLVECPRAEGKRGEAHTVEEWQTLYLGGQEVVSVREPDGTYRKQERSRAGLDPNTARDRCVPKELQVTEEAIKIATDEEAEEICDDFDEEMEHVMRGDTWRPVARATLMWVFDLIDCVREYSGSGGYWRTGGNDTGYTEINNVDIAADPVLRLFLRSDDVEVNQWRRG